VTAPEYVAARRVLLNALETLAPHRHAIIVAGAQAVYLRTQVSDIGIAPYTTDGDLALDPTLLGDEPELEAAMHAAGFTLYEAQAGHPEPGSWIASVMVAGRQLVVPIDLIVPDALAGTRGRRGARLPVHGNRAARRSVGLEAVLIDRSPMTIAALEDADDRSFEVDVAGPAALFVAKAHKIHDRLASARPGRLNDKDAADLYRLMQATRPTDVGATLAALQRDEMAGASTVTAVAYLTELFSRRNGEGVAMAARALRTATPEDQIATLATSYMQRVRDAIAAAGA
jgi:hypothetical protein